MAERRHEVTRIEGFSDAVFAFALTLLVVSLEVPKNMDDLADLMKGFIPFGAMFAMVCWIWHQHNLFFRRYGLEDAWTAALNSLLLFVLLFYVYPLKFLTLGGLGAKLGMNPDHLPNMSGPYVGRSVMLLYSSGVVLIFGTFTLLYQHAWRKRRELALSPEDEITLRFGRRSHIISALLGVASIGIATLIRTDWAPAPAGFIYFLLGPLHAWNGMAESKAKKALAAGTPPHA